MLRQERIEDPQEALRSALQGWQSELWTALPGILDSFDAPKMTAVVQPTIKGIFRSKKGALTNVQLPQCLDVPVLFIGGGGFSLTFPMAAGDEGLLVFSSRCIDAWWQSGGIQNQAEQRLHSLSDGFFIPGFRSVPRVLSDISTDSVQLRADDGTAYVDIAADVLTLRHPTKVVIDTPMAEFTTDVKINGALATTGDGSVGGGAQFVKLADGSNSTKLKAT